MSKLPRRVFMRLAAGAAALAIVPRAARGQTYPSRPVHVIFGFPAGGGSDSIARLMGRWLSERLGQPFVIENRPGNVTNLATEAVVHAHADGYTLLLATSPNATNATLYPNLSFNFMRDIVPVASIGRIANIMEANRSFPATTVQEFITYAEAEILVLRHQLNVLRRGSPERMAFSGIKPIRRPPCVYPEQLTARCMPMAAQSSGGRRVCYDR